MARFYFHIRDQDEYIVDPQGVELDNLAIAKCEASLAAREALAGEILHNVSVGHPQFEISDENGNLLLTLDFRQAAGL